MKILGIFLACVFAYLGCKGVGLVNDNLFAFGRLAGDTTIGVVVDGAQAAAEKISEKAQQTSAWKEAQAERTAAAETKKKQAELVVIQTEAAKSQIATNAKVAKLADKGAAWFAKPSNVVVINNGSAGATVEGAPTADESYPSEEEDTVQSEEIVRKAPSVASNRSKCRPRK
jgi:rhamnose utilization protein RhaD (predicted bifunctional aldolase and dehydrogenase)